MGIRMSAAILLSASRVLVVSALTLLLSPAFAAPAPDPDDEPTPEVKATTPARVLREVGFDFGSYGRVGAGTDLKGSTPRTVNVVAHGPRIIENTYVELDLYYSANPTENLYLRIVTTPALTGDLFHYSGDFDVGLALRNLYAEAIFSRTWGLWVGSRMYRGDDIYLLDFWPLDDLNMVGGGMSLQLDRFDASLAVGVNRLLAQYQFQEIQVQGRLQGADTIVQLDRQRFVGALKGQYRLLGSAEGPALKLKANLEIYGLPAGEARREDQSIEPLASDFGYAVGAQLGAWGFADRASHLNVFVRWGQGLGAFDELSVPSGFSETKQTFPGASELLLGLSGNYEVGPFGVLAGMYVRRFQDADRNERDVDDHWEGVVDVRPQIAATDWLSFALDASYQQRFPRGPSPVALEVLNPAVFQVAPMVQISPFGSGSYTRPLLRIVYAAAHLNAGARDLYPIDDARRDQTWVQFVGLQAEWWFNSTYR
jgi:maltoporin